MIRALFPLFSFFCLLCALSAEAADKKQELEGLRERIKDLQQALESTSESRDEAADALRSSERAISDSHRALSQIGRRQTEAAVQLRSLKGQSASLQDSITLQREALARMLYVQHLGNRNEHLRLLLRGEHPEQLARDWHYLESLARFRTQRLANLRRDLKQLDNATRETRHMQDEISQLKKSQIERQQDLIKEQAARQSTLRTLSGQIRSQRREIARMQRNESRLANLVNKLTKMLSEPRTRSLFKNDTLPDDRFDGKPFAQLKGRLSLPVRGNVTNRFDAKRPETGMRWKGIFLASASGQPVKAVAAGRVVFADWLRGFGNLLIIDHGKGYMSLYGNNETLYKQVGDTLSGGEVVSSTGSSGGADISGLYFELRHESNPIDPMQWISQ